MVLFYGRVAGRQNCVAIFVYNEDMSRWARERKFIVTLLIISLVMGVVFGILVRIVYKPETCYDGIKNQNEKDIDCGGVCDVECRQVLGEVDIIWTSAVRLAKEGEGTYDSNVYSLIALVENQNIDFIGENIEYEFITYDDEGALVTTIEHFTNIMPGTVTPIFYSGVETGKREIASVDIKFNKGIRFKKYDKELNLTFSDYKFENGDDPRASAKVVNNSVSHEDEIAFIAVIQDEIGNTVAVSRTLKDRLFPGEKEDIFFTWVNRWELYENSRCEGCFYQPKVMNIYPVIFGSL